MKDLQLNADRFTGFADLYDKTRPKAPAQVKEIIIKYLNQRPKVTVDLGCGTGLSANEFQIDFCYRMVIGVK